MYQKLKTYVLTALDYIASAVVYVVAEAVRVAKRFPRAAVFVLGNVTGAAALMAIALCMPRTDAGPKFEMAAVHPNTVGVPAPPAVAAIKPATKVEPVKREKPKSAPGKSLASKHNN